MSSTNLLSGVVESELDSSPGIRTFKLSGEPYANAIAGAVVANYHRITGRPKPTYDDLFDMIGLQVTLVTAGETMIGATAINAREGKLFASSSRTGLGILPKGARRKGFVVNPEDALDIIRGYDTQQAQALVDDVRAVYPRLRNLTQERLEQLPGEGEFDDVCSLALFGRWPMPDSVATDCIWLIGEYWPGDDICDRSVLLIRPEHGISETGSVYGRQLLQSQAVGEIVGFEPISYREAVHLCDLDFDEACAAVFGRATVTA